MKKRTMCLVVAAAVVGGSSGISGQDRVPPESAALLGKLAAYEKEALGKAQTEIKQKRQQVIGILKGHQIKAERAENLKAVAAIQGQIERLEKGGEVKLIGAGVATMLRLEPDGEDYQYKVAIPGITNSPKFYTIDADQSEGLLELRFSDPRLVEEFSKVASMTLLLHVADDPSAGTISDVTVEFEGEVIGTARSASANSWRRITLDHDAVTKSGQTLVHLMVKCGNDGVMVSNRKSGMGPVLEVVPE